MTQRFSIRDARADERPAISDLTLAAYEEFATIMTPSAWAGLHEALLGGLATEEAVRIVAEQNGKLVGSVMLYDPTADAYGGAVGSADAHELRLLAVAPEARGLGIGRALVEECIRRARQEGASAIGLHTSDSLQVAIQMYEQIGFVRIPERDFQPEGAELVKGYRLELR